MTMADDDLRDLETDAFSNVERRMIDRLMRRLGDMGAERPEAPSHLFYAAASAVECLRNGRSDARYCLSTGLGEAAAGACLETARMDARFYLRLAAPEAVSPPVSVHSPEQTQRP